MPLINVDAKGLEWVCAVYLSGDKIGYKELIAREDIHTNNQTGLKLPTRNLAKVFLFRIIYADELSGGAYAFSLDPEFAHISSSTRWWQDRIDTFFTKYSGLARCHREWLETVGSSGLLTTMTGRTYQFFREMRKGEQVYSKAKIYNYPVQGLGADLMSIVRVSLHKRMVKAGYVSSHVVSTVHDSIVLDVLPNEVYDICKLIFKVFEDVPKNFEALFKKPFDLPFLGEIKVGNNLGDMHLITQEQLNANSN